jgi:hypothetical protein
VSTTSALTVEKNGTLPETGSIGPRSRASRSSSFSTRAECEG